MAELLSVVIFALLSTIFGGALYRFAFLDASLAALLGAFLFLVLLQVRMSVTRVRDARSFEDGLETLRAANAAMKSQIDDTKKNMDQVTTTFAQRSESQARKVTGELQVIERLIRDFASRAAKAQADTLAETTGTASRSASAHGAAMGFADTNMLEMIRRALEENRVDLYLQPVVGLPQRKVRFYEALSRLRSEDGAVIMPAQYIKVAAPAGLMSVVDNLLLFRCIQVVRRLTQKTREIAVFCNLSGHTLKDAEFFPQFLDFIHHHKDLASQIIFEFSEDAVLSAGESEEANLKYLSRLGFRLSMDQVTKLDLDFAKLKRLGFEFVKVRAATLIHGMSHARALVAVEDFKDLLARNGINLIAERIEDEKTVVQLLEYNLDFGQGYLFGEPRPVKDVAEIFDPRSKQPNGAAITAQIAPLAKRLAG